MSLTKVSYSMINGAVFNVLDYGATGDGTTDDTAAFQAAVNAAFTPEASNFGGSTLFIPRGNYKITTVITLPNAQFNITGAGSSSVITCVGCSAFRYPGQFTTISKLENLWISGDSTANTEAFNSNPTNTSWVFARVNFSNLEIVGFPRMFNVPNAQICSWDKCVFNGNSGGSVFYVYATAAGQAANSNRVTNCQITGPNVKTVDFDPSLFSARSTNWLFDSCDFQQFGNINPAITVSDGDWVIRNCEFENNTSPCDVDIVNTDYAAQAYNTSIDSCTMGGFVTTAHIRIRRTGVTQKPYYNTIKNINVGGSNLVEITSGRSTTIINCAGVVTDSGGEFTVQIAGSQLLPEAGIKVVGAYINTALWTSGNGTPEGAVTAVVGSLYTRLNGGAVTTLYVKESGTGNTGWVAK
jgi:hypothetical protein